MKKTKIGLICSLSATPLFIIPITLSVTSCSDNVKSSPKEWFQFSDKDSSVVTGLNKELIGNASELIFPDFVTDIEPGIFGMDQVGSDNKFWPNLKKIDLSLTKITSFKDMVLNPETGEGGAGVFSYLFGLEEIILPNNIKSIGEGTFWMSANLKQINFPKSLKEIGSWSFAGCKSLTQVDLTNLETIGYSAFSESGLTSLLLPGNINYKSPDRGSASTFSRCANLKELTILNNVTTIKNSMFQFTAIEKLHIPSNVEVIEEDAFYTDKPIKQVIIEKDSKLKSIFGDSFNYGQYNKNNSNTADIVFYVPNEDIKKIFVDANYPETIIKVYSDVNEIPKIN